MPHGQWAPLDADTPVFIDRSARLVEPCVVDGASLLLLPVLVQAASSTSGAESTVDAAHTHREALLKVLSLLRTARSELLCRHRRVTATASSTPFLEGLSLHFLLMKKCCDRGFPLRCSYRWLQLLRKVFTEISCSCSHLVDGVGRLGFLVSVLPVSFLTTVFASSHKRDARFNVLSFWTLQFDSVLCTLVKPSISPRAASPSLPQFPKP